MRNQIGNHVTMETVTVTNRTETDCSRILAPDVRPSRRTVPFVRDQNDKPETPTGERVSRNIALLFRAEEKLDEKKKNE